MSEPNWVIIDKARRALADQFKGAYASSGVTRVRWFWFLAITGWREGLWSAFGALKIMTVGCLFGRSVNIR